VEHPAESFTSADAIGATVESIAREYPAALAEQHLKDVPRVVFHIQRILGATGPRGSVCDIGGGLNLFSLGCAVLGLDATLVDDFSDNPPFIYDEIYSAFLTLQRRYGVKLVRADVVRDQPEFPPSSFDAVCSFHSMKHWHHSPKAFFRGVAQSLKPGGLFLLCGPNCVNLRKRITAPLGRSNWSSMEDWYEQNVFRGHVREPHVEDLRYIARDMGLARITVYGRNWLGYNSRWPLVGKLATVADPVLRQFPSLCSDIYVEGRRP
jgi:SAM-dependent methyltransferase